MPMKHGTRLPVLGCLALLVAGCGPAAHTAPSRGAFVYVANKGRDGISQFAAPLSSGGALRPISPLTVPAGPFPYTVAVDPQGTSAYATSSASKIYQYTISAATGRLTPKSPATVATRSGGTAAIAFTPDGKSAYVVGTSISQYSINPATGKLTPKSPATVATPPNPEPIAVSPDGKYAYVANCGGCGYAHKPKTPSRAAAGPAPATRPAAKPSYLMAYRINPRTGALSSRPVAKVRTGNGANWIAIAPDGTSAYVATSTGVWQYTISPATGELFPKTPRSAGPAEHNIVISPDGKYAYVIGDTSRGVCRYRFNPRTGPLTPKPASTAPTVLNPEALALSADGKNAYVTSENDGKVAQYKIAPATGKITPMSPATVATASGSLGLAVTP